MVPWFYRRLGYKLGWEVVVEVAGKHISMCSSVELCDDSISLARATMNMFGHAAGRWL